MGCVFVLSYFSRKYIFKECLGIIARAIKYVLFHFLWLLFYDSTDLLTRSKILAFLNIPYWLGLMGFQNKWIGFLNLSKDRAQGLFGTPVASSECRFRLHRLSRDAESHLISNLLFLMEAEDRDKEMSSREVRLT